MCGRSWQCIGLPDPEQPRSCAWRSRLDLRGTWRRHKAGSRRCGRPTRRPGLGPPRSLRPGKRGGVPAPALAVWRSSLVKTQAATWPPAGPRTHRCRVTADRAGFVARRGLAELRIFDTRSTLLGGIHLTGLSQVGGSPWPGRFRAVQARRVPPGSGRLPSWAAWVPGGEQVVVADRVVPGG